MRHKAQLTVPRVLEQHWRSLIHETSVSEYVFVSEVRSHYEQLIPPYARSIEWSQHPDITTRMKRDAEKLSRWFDKDVHARFPVEAIEAFIVAFPVERRFALQQELAKRQDLLAVKMPKAGAGVDVEHLGRLGKETGEAIIAISQMLDDNKINELDKDKAENALRQIDDAMAVYIEMRKRIVQQALGGKEPTNGEWR